MKAFIPVLLLAAAGCTTLAPKEMADRLAAECRSWGGIPFIQYGFAVGEKGKEEVMQLVCYRVTRTENL